jgi:hypothetical protein
MFNTVFKEPFEFIYFIAQRKKNQIAWPPASGAIAKIKATLITHHL